MNPRYSIGIDLGTTNCALAYVDLAKADAESEVLSLRQKETAATEVDRSSLPSFLFLEDDGNWEVGLYARERGRDLPDRLVHSAKSWLCHHSVSPEAKTLPWKSKGVDEEKKLSPIDVAARLLIALKEAWEERFGKEAPFVEQMVTVTVPASFDAAAQAATLKAARLAGYPSGVRLLEEPQAAFYRWLESAGKATESLVEGECILVVDIGGGTSDFSKFKVGPIVDGRPIIERISVSDHLLLGGDNIDLALAHALESELVPNGEELSVDQWGHLISRARDLKETCLSEADDRSISVSLPSKGSALFAGTLSTEVSSQLARDMILEGFFPECPAGIKAERAAGGLLEIGLPYAVDCAVSRHLSEFLDGTDRVDHVLFNGGSLAASLIQKRLLSLLAGWHVGQKPTVLENRETDLAVARGAAFSGATYRKGERRISAGVARSIFLEIGSGDAAKHVCVLPQGAQAGESFEIEIPNLSLAVNQRSRFQAYQGADGMSEVAGEWYIGSLDTMRKLPALDAAIELKGRGFVPVYLKSGVNELGLLTVSCESVDKTAPGVWPLEFNLRKEASASAVSLPKDLGVAPSKLERAGRVLKGGLLARGAGLKASRVLKEVESALGLMKHEWNLELCRSLLNSAFEAKAALGGNPEAWLQVSGYLMRPGFGSAGDEERLRKLSLAIEGIEVKPAKVEIQLLILLRRVVAGMSEDEQSELFERELLRLEETKRAEAERVRLLASLENIGLSQKQRLYDALFRRLEDAIAADSHIAPLIAGFGLLLSRVLFRAGEDRIMPPDTVERLFDRVRKLDWKSSRNTDAIPLFLKAARVVEDRNLNLARRSSAKIISKLEKSGVGANRLLPLRDYVPISRAEQDFSYGESLPPGLLLS